MSPHLAGMGVGCVMCDGGGLRRTCGCCAVRRAEELGLYMERQPVLSRHSLNKMEQRVANAKLLDRWA